jgi:hypothetical protein
MTGFECLQRQHPEAASIVKAETSAWEAYYHYILVRTPARGGFFEGDETSFSLFRSWQKVRQIRDGISNPRHKRDNIRFQRA